MAKEGVLLRHGFVIRRQQASCSHREYVEKGRKGYLEADMKLKHIALCGELLCVHFQHLTEIHPVSHVTPLVE
jgi:hypothetical protein